MSSQMVLSYGDVVIREDDLQLLDAPNWLNDTIIEFAYEYLERNGGSQGLKPNATTQTGRGQTSIAFLRPAIVHLLAHGVGVSDLGLKLEAKDLIFIPINDNEDDVAGGGHWSLLVYHRSTNAFYYYDSMGSSNKETAIRTKLTLQKAIDQKNVPSFVAIEAPMQNNAYDCGMYVIAFTELLAKRLYDRDNIADKPGDLSYWRLARVITPADITKKRKELRELILFLRERSIN